MIIIRRKRIQYLLSFFLFFSFLLGFLGFEDKRKKRTAKQKCLSAIVTLWCWGISIVGEEREKTAKKQQKKNTTKLK